MFVCAWSEVTQVTAGVGGGYVDSTDPGTKKENQSFQDCTNFTNVAAAELITPRHHNWLSISVSW